MEEGTLAIWILTCIIVFKVFNLTIDVKTLSELKEADIPQA